MTPQAITETLTQAAGPALYDDVSTARALEAELERLVKS